MNDHDPSAAPEPSTVGGVSERFEHRLVAWVRGPRVLELGCGSGNLCILLARAGLTTCGVDSRHDAIEAARRALAAEPDDVRRRVTFRVLDALKADFAPASFDTVIVRFLPEDQPARVELWNRVRRWLRPDGRFALAPSHAAARCPDAEPPPNIPRLIQLLAPVFAIEAIDFLGNPPRLLLTGRRPEAAPPPLDPQRILQWTARADEALRAALADAREARRRTAARAERLADRTESLQTELAELAGGMRYRLGDALVRAVRPSRDTILLPVRLARLLADGLWRVRSRRKQARRRRLQTRSGPGRSGASAEKSPFAAAPPEQIVRPELRIAGVMDEFSWRAWQFEADLFTFGPEDWQERLEAHRPHLLLIESAWDGVGDRWYFQVRDLGKRPDIIRHYAIPDIVAWCRRHDIPTVFYNKEDPPNFDVFIDAARCFDYVFTSDANCIDDYRRQLGHDRVFALPFAAQPRIHNPVLTEPRSGTVCFAGTWYRRRHLRRQADAHAILRPALDFGLEIFDRMAGSDDPDYRWPDPYRPAVRGALPYAEMLAAYKRYKVFVNINSVTDSPTMFSRRVFELLASGTPVVSSYSLGIERLLGPELVGLSRDEATTRALLERLLGDDEYRERLALRGQRKVFCEHTCTHRLTTILDTIGLTGHAAAPARMACIAAIEHPAQIEPALAHFQRQDYPHKTLLLCCTDAEAAESARRAAARHSGIRAVCETGAAWGTVLSRAAEAAPADFLAALHPSDYYGPHYLTDYANATRYVTEPAIGKSCHYWFDGTTLRVKGSGGEYRYVPRVHPPTLCLRRHAALARVDELRSVRGVWEWWEDAVRGFGRLYSSDRFNYVRRTPPGDASPANAACAPPTERSPAQFAPAVV